jgi:prefoldin subunit 5
MSTRPIDSVFDVPERVPSQNHAPALSDPHSAVLMSETSNQPNQQDINYGADVAHTPETDVEWTNAELHSIASTIEELQRRLELANTRLSSVATVEATELEIGRLFVEAQRFSEESLSKLERQIHEVLCAAEDKAKEILTEATEEALEIRRQAQEAALMSTRTARELQSAIAGFTTVNNELIKELGALNSMLTPVSERGPTEIDPSSGVSEDN